MCKVSAPLAVIYLILSRIFSLFSLHLLTLLKNKRMQQESSVSDNWRHLISRVAE